MIRSYATDNKSTHGIGKDRIIAERARGLGIDLIDNGFRWLKGYGS